MARPACLGMLLAGLILAPLVTRAAGLEYRDRCPEPMTLVDTEAYFCRIIEHRGFGKRVESAYQAQVAHLHEIYAKPENTADLEQELAVLEASQNGWKTYTANQCAAEGYMAWRGSLETTLVAQCIERLAGLRIKELEDLKQGLGN